MSIESQNPYGSTSFEVPLPSLVDIKSNDRMKQKPNRRFRFFILFFLKMERDECNLIAAKAFNARMNGDKKRAAELEQELADLRSGKKRRQEEKSKKVQERNETGDVEIISPLDEHGNILPALLKKVCFR